MPRKFAIITDAHANLPALEAALQAIAAEGCDAIYHTGDALNFGPYPAEVLDRLLHTPNLRHIMGNHDELFVRGVPSPRPAGMVADERSHYAWVHAQLDSALRDVVAGWPYAITEHVFGVGLLFTHYSRNATGTAFAPLVRNPTPTALDRLFAGQPADLVFYGHHHLPSDLHGAARYVNIGALGCSHDPIAPFALLTINNDGTYRLEKRAVPYDQTNLFRQFVIRNVPNRDFICRALLGQNPQPA